MAANSPPTKNDSEPDQSSRQAIDTEVPQPRLVYSDAIGFPPFVLDPNDLLPCSKETGTIVQHSGDNTIVKFGHDVRLSEAAAMLLVSRNTTVPVPDVKAAYVLDGIGYIVMSYEEGISLAKYWPTSSSDQRKAVITQLRDYFSQIRTIKADYLGGADRTQCTHWFFQQYHGDPDHAYGPYDSEANFNEALVQTLVDRSPPERRASYDPNRTHGDLVASIRAFNGHETVLTHCDLRLYNFLVRPDGTVVVMGWGSAGFYPAYWEYCCAKMKPLREDWGKEIGNLLDPCEEDGVMRRFFYVATH